MHHQELFISLQQLTRKLIITILWLRIAVLIIVKHIADILFHMELVHTPQSICSYFWLSCLFDNGLFDLEHFVTSQLAFHRIKGAILRAFVFFDELLGESLLN